MSNLRDTSTTKRNEAHKLTLRSFEGDGPLGGLPKFINLAKAVGPATCRSVRAALVSRSMSAGFRREHYTSGTRSWSKPRCGGGQGASPCVG